MKPFEQWLDEMTDDLRKKQETAEVKTLKIANNVIRHSTKDVSWDDVKWYNEVNTGWVQPGNSGGISLGNTGGATIKSPPVEKYGTQLAKHYSLEIEKAFRQHFFNTLYMQRVEIPEDGKVVFPISTRATSNA